MRVSRVPGCGSSPRSQDAREARSGEKTRRVRDRSQSMGRTLRASTRTIRRRTGDAKTEVLKLTAKPGEFLDVPVPGDEASRRGRAQSGRGRSARAKLKAADQLEELANRCDTATRQIKLRVAGEPISDRLLSATACTGPTATVGTPANVATDERDERTPAAATQGRSQLGPDQTVVLTPRVAQRSRRADDQEGQARETQRTETPRRSRRTPRTPGAVRVA